MTTPTNSPARAATSPELTLLRSNGQASILGLAIQKPAAVYTARINQTFSSGVDGVYQLTYDGGSGTLANVLVGMTVFIGSTAGANDKGVCRVRQLPTSSVLYINQVSHIQFADNDYITVLDEFRLWQRDITNTGGVIAMDYDIEFGNYQNGGVIPRIGPLMAVVHSSAGTATFVPPNPSLSAAYDGATIVSYQFAGEGSPTITNSTSATSVSYSWSVDGNPHLYRWSCAITDSLGRITTSYRWVYIDPPDVNFKLNGSVVGDYESGDWSYNVTLFDNVTISDIYDRALVTLFTQDYFSSAANAVGKLAGYENIICSGWVDGESIVYDSEKGSVTFDVHGANYWLSKLRAFPFELTSTASAPTSWKQIQDMTVDKALAHILYWTSTAPLVMDCFFTGDTNIVNILAQPAGTLLQQIESIARSKIFAKPITNNLGQMFVEIDTQLISSADRASLPVVMALTTGDYVEPFNITRISDKTAQIEFNADSSYDGTAVVPVYSRAPGTIGSTFGNISSYDGYLVTDQDECNRIAGCLLALENNDYEPIELDLQSNNRLFDIAPRMFATISIDPADNPRGLTFSTTRLIPRRVEYAIEEENQLLTTKVNFEVETTGVDGVTYIPPVIGEENVNTDLYTTPEFSAIKNVDFPALDTWFPDIVPPNVTTPCSGYAHTYFSLGWSPSELDGGNPDKLIAKAYFPCKLRGASGPSYIDLKGLWYGDAPAHYNVFAVKGGARVATASLSGFRASFSLLSDTEVDGFELELDAGLGSTITYIAGNIVSSGSIPVASSAGATISTTSGNYYSIESSGGPYNPDPSHSEYASYVYQKDNTGRIGYNSIAVWGGNYYWSTLPTGGLFHETVDSYHGRVYFLAGSSSFTMRVYDEAIGPGWTDNTGSLSYILRAAEARGRRIKLSPSTLTDVCAL